MHPRVHTCKSGVRLLFIYCMHATLSFMHAYLSSHLLFQLERGGKRDHMILLFYALSYFLSSICQEHLMSPKPFLHHKDNSSAHWGPPTIPSRGAKICTLGFSGLLRNPASWKLGGAVSHSTPFMRRGGRASPRIVWTRTLFPGRRHFVSSRCSIM